MKHVVKLSSLLVVFLIPSLAVGHSALENSVKQAASKVYKVEQRQDKFVESAYEGQYDWVKTLYREGAWVNIPHSYSFNGATALIAAAQADSDAYYKVNYLKYQRITAYLLAKGADKNAKDNWGMTALMWAAKQGHFLMVQQLTKKSDLP